jgi:hypothetical protein
LISIQKVNAAALACNANETAQTFTFGGGNTWPSAVQQLTYNVYDMDYSASGASNFRDRIVATRNGGGFPTAMTAVTPANETITLATGNAVATTSANCAGTDTGCNIEIQFNTTGISSASTQFLAAHASGTTAQQSIGFGEYSWCLPTTCLRVTSSKSIYHRSVQVQAARLLLRIPN